MLQRRRTKTITVILIGFGYLGAVLQYSYHHGGMVGVQLTSGSTTDANQGTSRDIECCRTLEAMRSISHARP